MEIRADRRDIAIILFRGLSVYSFVKAVELLSNKFMYFFNKENYSFEIFIQIIGPSALLVICGSIIWYLSPMIASCIPKGSGRDEIHGLSINDLQHVAFSSIGLFIIANTIPDIVTSMGVYYAIAFYTAGGKGLGYVTETFHLVALTIRLVMGIWLLIGCRGVFKIIRALQRD